VAEEGIHYLTAHLPRDGASVEPQEQPQPLLNRFHRAARVVAYLQLLAIALDQAWLC
jgi:hypothetical protein